MKRKCILKISIGYHSFKRETGLFLKQSNGLKIMLCFSLLVGCRLGYTQPLDTKSDSLPTDQTFVNWAIEHAFPLQNSDNATGTHDLQPLRKMIGKARVVALGEPAHGLHEPLAFRNRLFRFLVEECGFTTIVLEAGLAEARLAADFVAGGQVTAQAAAGNLTIGKPAAETIELLQWMKAYNAKPGHKRKVTFFGMDMQLKGFPNDTTPSHAALDEALTYLTQVDSSAATEIAFALAPYKNRLSVANYPLLSAQEHDRLSAGLDDLIALFERQRLHYIGISSKERYEWAYRNAVVARQTDRLARVLIADPSGKILPEAWTAVNTRDAAMAENVLWVLNQQIDGGKILVYSHNGHAENAVMTGGVWDAFARAPNSAGQYLRSILGKDFFIIGTSFPHSLASAQPGSLDKMLMKVGQPRFLLNLRSAAGHPAVAAWLAIPRPMEANIMTYLKPAPGTAFDAILFISKDNVTKN